MQKRLVLTLLVAVGCACPIFAARAKYEIAAGTYLPAGATVAARCPANSYCPGIADAKYDNKNDQGVTSCPSGYPNSAAGASTETQCYTACTVDTVEHATAVDGNDYYGTGVDTCVATACKNGYYVEASTIEVVEQTPLIDVDYTVAGNAYGFISADGGITNNTSTYGLTEKGTWAAKFNYGVVYGRASCQATPHDPGPAYVSANRDAILYNRISSDTVRSDLTPIVGAVKANYMADVVAGIADGSLLQKAYYEALYVVFGLSKDASFSTTDTGQYCYCQMTGFREAGATETLEVDSASAPWVFQYGYGSADDCAVECADSCALRLYYVLVGSQELRGAVFGSLGVGEFGTCAANEITYQIAAGTYLPAGATVAEQCPANSYCPGIADATYNESAAQGVTACPSGYPNSAAGASTDTQCYTACTVDSVEHATAVADGNDYYGTGVDTCAATACENGYHVEASTIEVVEQTPLIDVDYTVAGNDYGYLGVSHVRNHTKYGLTERGTWATEFDYGVVYGRTSCQATPHDPGIEYMWANYSANFYAIRNGEISPDTVRSDLTPIVGAAKANYMADVAAGIADGSLDKDEALWEAVKVVFDTSKDASFSPTDTGKYCYCQMTGFREAGSTETLEIDESSAPWAYIYDCYDAWGCSDMCAAYCAERLHYGYAESRAYRGAVFGALGTAGFGACAANEITINWTDATADDIAANNAGMCTYDGEIRTPVRAITILGKRFVGWKFNKPAQE